jgi:hypothetical protein
MRNCQRLISISAFNPYPIDPIPVAAEGRFLVPTGCRLRAHNTWQWMRSDDRLCLTWFNAGLRIVAWSNPFEPKELGYYIPAGIKQSFVPRPTRSSATAIPG